MGFPEQPAGLAHQFAAGDFRDPRAAAGDGHPHTAADAWYRGLPAGRENWIAAAASISRQGASTSAKSAQSRRQSSAGRIACSALDGSSSNAMFL